jgi:hypothetical protein
MTDWLTYEAPPARYAEDHPIEELRGQEMPDYRPGTIRGHIRGEDAWQMMVVMQAHFRAWEAVDNCHDGWDFAEYIWSIEAETHDLDIWGMRDRVVSGFFWVTDELNYMRFMASFQGDQLQCLVTEVDTDWQPVYRYDGMTPDGPEHNLLNMP